VTNYFAGKDVPFVPSGSPSSVSGNVLVKSTNSSYVGKNGLFVEAEPPTISGLLSAGSDKNILSGTQFTFNLIATFTGSLEGKTILWEQVEGEPGSFSSTDTLTTSFTTAVNPSTNVVLRITLFEKTPFGIASKTDSLDINVDPKDNIYVSTKISSTSTSSIYYVASKIGTQIFNEDGSYYTGSQIATQNTIYWSKPISSDYYGYLIQQYNPTNQKWITVANYPSALDVGYYIMPAQSTAYRYVPIWNKGGTLINGTSDGPFKVRISNNSISTLDINLVGSVVPFGQAETVITERTVFGRSSKSFTDNVTVGPTEITSVFTSLTATRITYSLSQMPEQLDSVHARNTEINSYFDSVGVTRVVYTLQTLPV